jgi:hypothetical protein
VSLNRTIAALVPDWPVLPPTDRTQIVTACTRFVRAQLGLAPFHIRFGFRVLFLAFQAYTPFRAGLFPNAAGRARALASFSALPLPLVAGLERLLRASTMLAFFDHPLVLKALREDTPAERQQTFRSLRARQSGGAP